jgi:hypothetical protein
MVPKVIRNESTPNAAADVHNRNRSQLEPELVIGLFMPFVGRFWSLGPREVLASSVTDHEGAACSEEGALLSPWNGCVSCIQVVLVA